MPTKLPRLSVTRDPELERALELAGHDAQLAHLSAAGQMRALALLGAAALQASDGLNDARRAIIQAGAKLATADLLTVSRQVRQRTVTTVIDETPSETLAWVRGDR